MKRKHIYIGFMLLMGSLIMLRNKDLFTFERVEQGEEEGSFSDDWYPIISQEVNEKHVSLFVDGTEITGMREQAVMDEAGHFLIPVSVLTEAFSCSARVYDDSRLVIEKNTVRAELTEGEPFITVKDEKKPLEASLVKIDGSFYVPSEAIEKSLSYGCSWDANNSRLTMTAADPLAAVLPPSYDYREAGRAPRVKNQGTLGTCWAFASLMAMESRLLPEENFDFSEDHMSRKNSFHMEQNDGGEYTMSMAYLLAWQGPVLEQEDIYGDELSPEGLKPTKHVQNIEVLPEKDYEAIKEAVFFYGGVQSSLYTSMVSGERESGFYNKEAGAYCYIGTARPNHDVVIIGWDDNYPKENFTVVPEKDGAFICANSWGGEFGDEGYFYVSYYDVNIGIHNILYRRVDNPGIYDNIYQSDLCGWVGQLGYGKESAWFANVYETKVQEELTAAGFYATGGDTSYEIYTVTNVEGSGSFGNRQLAARGTVKNSGYYTIDFQNPVTLKPGERFAVIVNITTPDSVHPVAIEYNAPDKLQQVELNDGEGYISFKGSSWERVEQSQNCNVCLKAYTKEVTNDGK